MVDSGDDYGNDCDVCGESDASICGHIMGEDGTNPPGSARTLANLKKKPPDMEYVLGRIKAIEARANHDYSRLEKWSVTLQGMISEANLGKVVYALFATTWMSWLTWMVIR